MIDRPGNYGNAEGGRKEDPSRPSWTGPRGGGCFAYDLHMQIARPPSSPHGGAALRPPGPRHVGPVPHGLPPQPSLGGSAGPAWRHLGLGPKPRSPPTTRPFLQLRLH